ncbi:MAG: hypothetical protein K9M03_04735, partial [Kiritimatiellales bacterium]|nr:hypothetical protein [Kiritimatiellales bacterium]
YAIEPNIQVAAISGTAVVFAASTPYDDMTITMSGGGLMSQRNFTKEGGTEVLFGQLFFDASNPAGDYPLTITNNKGIELDQMMLRWSNRELSLVNASDKWSADSQVAGMMMRGDSAVQDLALQTEQLANVTEAVMAQTGLSSKNVDSYPIRREFQEMELWNVSQFHMTQDELAEAYYSKNPAMRDPATEQLRTMRSESLGALWENLHVYGSSVGRILDRAINVYFESQRGGNQQEAIAAVQTEIDIVSGIRKNLELEIETGIKLPNLGQAMAEGLKIYEEHVDIFYNIQEMALRDFVKEERRSSDPYWQIVYGGQSPAGSNGIIVASAGGIEEVMKGVDIPMLKTEVPRRVQRIQRKIEEMENRSNNGGYVDPRFKNWMDTRDDYNEQRVRWESGFTTVLRGFAGESEEEQGPEEEDPLKPSLYTLEGEVAALNVVIDVAVEGVRKQEELRFGEELEAYLAEHGAQLSESIRDAFAQIPEQANVESYIKAADDKWTVMKGNSSEVINNTNKIINGDLSPLTNNGATILGSENTDDQIETDSNYLASSLKQVYLGNYTDEVTLLGTSGQITLGFLGADIPADIRDIIWDIQNWEWSWGHIGQTSLDGISFLPVIGALKYGDEIHILLKGRNNEVTRIVGKMNQNIQTDIATTILKSGNGHILSDHIGQTTDQLLEQLKHKPNAPAATSFLNTVKAWEYTTEAQAHLTPNILEWIKKVGTDANQTKYFDIDLGNTIGYGIRQGNNAIESTTQIRVIVRNNGAGGFILEDAYPIFQ